MSGQSEMLSKAEDIADKVSQPTQQLTWSGRYIWFSKYSSLFDLNEVPNDLSFLDALNSVLNLFRS